MENSKFTQQTEVAMRNIVSLILATVFIGTTFTSSATAGDRYYYHEQQQNREAQVIVGAGLAILGLAVIAGNQRPAPPRFYEPRPYRSYSQPRYNAPQRHRCPHLGNYQGRLYYDPNTGCYYPD